MSILKDLLNCRTNRKQLHQLQKKLKKQKKQIEAKESALKAFQKPSAPPSRRVPYQSEARRKGTSQTAELLIQNVSTSARTAIDLGCNEGSLSLVLARLGLATLGVEGGKVTEGSRKTNAKMARSLAFKTDFITPENIGHLDEADVVMLLSVHHQLVANLGENTANDLLIAIAKKAKQQFFFMPACIRKKFGPAFEGFTDNDYEGIDAYFRKLFDSHGFEIRLLGQVENKLPPNEPLRPLYLVTRGGQSWPSGIPNNADQIDSPSELRTVDLSLCRIGPAGSVIDGGWHYFRDALDHVLRTGDSDYANNPLRTYYQKMQPQNLAEYLSPWNPERLAELKNLLPPPAIPSPWLDHPLPPTWMRFLMPSESSPETSHASGPTSDEMGAKHLEALINVHQSIGTLGYLPDTFPDGYIRGYFLRNSAGDIRFVVTGGQHRIAAIGALGTSKVRIRFQPGHPRLVEEGDLPTWPGVRLGLFSEKQARQLFSNFFSDHSSEFRHFFSSP